jgi:hypothetical protein
MSNKGDFAAGQRLLEIKQTGTTREYANEFRTLASHAGWNDAPLIFYFYKGLCDEVKDIICMEKRPNSLEEYIQRAQIIDEGISTRKEERKEAQKARKAYRQGAS